MANKKYLYQKITGEWVFGVNKNSICPAGIYRLDVATSGALTIRHIYNRDIADQYASPLSGFLKENGQEYSSLNEFIDATNAFFSSKITVNLSSGDLQIGAVELKNADSDARVKVGNGSAMASDDNALAVADANALAAMAQLKSQQFAENGIHLLTGVNAAPAGTYAGFIPLAADTAIASITVTDTNKVTGANDFSGITLVQGMYYTIPGGFSTVSLSAGDMILVKQ